MKIIAVQINPEYMETPMSIFGVPEDIIITGNRYFDDHVTTDYENVVRALESGEDMDSFGDGYSWYRNATDFFTTELPRDRKYTTQEIGKLKKLFAAYGESDRDDAEITAKVLSLVTGLNYKWHCISGYSQSDWNNLLCPDGYDVRALESEYFGMGAEYSIAVLDDETKTDITDAEELQEYVWSYLNTSCQYFPDGCNVAEQIAQEYGADVKDVVIVKFDGYEKIERYKIA